MKTKRKYSPNRLIMDEYRHEKDVLSKFDEAIHWCGHPVSKAYRFNGKYKQREKTWRDNNRERLKQYRAEHYKENKARIDQHCREYNKKIKANPEKELRRQEKYKQWYEKNKATILQKCKDYRDMIKACPERWDKRRKVQKDWKTNNLERVRENARNQRRKERQDPKRRVVHALRMRLWQMIVRYKGNKSASALTLAGCSRADLLKHIEAQFKRGQNWSNYGAVWELDHIQPCSSFDLTDPAQQRQCFHFTNLRPLSVTANRSKSFAITVPQLTMCL